MRETNTTTVGTSEIADRVGVTSQTMLRLAREPACPVMRVGRILRWPVAETLVWLRARQQEHVAHDIDGVTFGGSHYGREPA